jgi:serine/threonine-protein kinase
VNGASALNSGERLGRFVILGALGAGGMGEVYRARDERLEREVAIKVLPRETFADAAARDRFHKEARALARLSHPNIGQVFDFTSEGTTDFLVMELVPGRSLASRIDAGPIPENEILGLGRQLAAALEAAHDAGVIHRDLKPGNLMLPEAGFLKVLDFGLAKVLHRDRPAEATLTQGDTQSVSGTVPYMAPEQLLGETVDERTDVWAAGIVLYECVTGKRPFDETLSTRLTHAILTRDPDPPARKPPDRASDGLARIIMKCLEKDPGRRYQTAAELGADLARLEATGTVKVKANASRHAARKSSVFFGSAALALAAVVLVIWHPWSKGRAVAAPPAPIASLAVLPLDNFTGDASQEYFSDGMTEALISELAKIRSLRVVSRKSVMPFKKTALSLPEIGRKLGVEGVIEGSVRRGAGRVSVTAELIRAASDEHVWTQSFERQETDVLSLHGDIARAIAGQIQAALTPDEARSLQAGGKIDPKAYDLVLRANYLAGNAAGPDDAVRALDLAQKAVEAAPESALTNAGLANVLLGLISFGVKAGREILPLARAAAEKAARLDPDLVEASVARVGVLDLSYEFEEAYREIRRLLDLRPNDAGLHSMLGYHSAMLGRFETMEPHLRKAVELDPLLLWLRCNLMNVLYALDRNEEAVAAANEILALAPKWFWANSNLSGLALLRGDKAEALAQSVKSFQSAWPDFGPPAGTGWDGYLRWLPEELERKEGKSMYLAGFIAAAYALAGERDKAISFLEREVEERGIWTIEMFWPEFDSLRRDPRFLALIRKMNLPVEVYDRPFREVAASARR